MHIYIHICVPTDLLFTYVAVYVFRQLLQPYHSPLCVCNCLCVQAIVAAIPLAALCLPKLYLDRLVHSSGTAQFFVWLASKPVCFKYVCLSRAGSNEVRTMEQSSWVFLLKTRLWHRRYTANGRQSVQCVGFALAVVLWLEVGILNM